MLQFAISIAIDDCLERISCILIAVFVHIQTCNGEAGLPDVRRFAIGRRNLVCRCFCRVKITIDNLHQQCFIRGRCRMLRCQLLCLILIDADKQTHADDNAADNIGAILRPPGTDLVNLFFF